LSERGAKNSRNAATYHYKSSKRTTQVCLNNISRFGYPIIIETSLGAVSRGGRFRQTERKKTNPEKKEADLNLSL
jgi:hypothetical protein